MKTPKSHFAFTAMLVLLLTVFTTVNLGAQSIVSGDVTGTVTDPSGAIVPNAQVTLKNNDTGVTQTTNTGNSGQYRFAFQKPGRYTVSVTTQGFQTVSVPAFVSVGQATRADVRLAVGQTSQTVEVTAETPLVQTDNGNVSTSFNTAEIAALPSPGGDITYVAQNAPGVAVNTSSGGGYGNFTANGLPATANLFTVNGNDEMDPYLNLNNSGASNLTLGANELAEATVTTNGYTGEFGRNAGAQVNYATKSGTNGFHGNAIYYWTGAALVARDWFNKGTNPNTHDHQWAASIGGPIIRNKTFFFADVEGINYTLPTSQVVYVPSAGFQAATIANLASTGMSTSIPFYQNMFNLYNNAKGAAGATPFANAACPAIFPTGCVNSFRATPTSSAHEWILIGRVDHQFTSADRVFFRYKTDHGLQPTYTDPISPIFNANSNQPSYEGQANWAHNFSAAVNQLIVSGSYYSAIFKPANQAAALQAFPYGMIGFDLTNLGGENYAFPQGRNVTQYQIVDDFTKPLGNHNVKVGVNFRRNDVTDFQYSSRFVFPLAEEVSLDTFAAGAFDVVQQRFPSRLSQPFALYSLGMYIQDQWKMSPKFSLTLAVRGDHNSNPVCRTNCFAESVSSFNQISHDPTIPYNQVVRNGLSTAYHSLEAVAWQPRIGFAYAPFGNTTTAIRGGIGVFADIFPATLAGTFSRNIPQQVAFTAYGLNAAPGVTGNALTALASGNSALRSIYANGGTVTDLTNAEAAAGLTIPLFPNLNIMQNNVKNPKFIKWNLEFDQSIGTRNSISLNYNGNHGRDIFVNNAGVNAFCIPARCGAAVPGFPSTSFDGGTLGNRQSPIDPRFGSVSQWYNHGVSNYNGATVSFMRKYATLQMTASYTWSHSLDDVSNGGVLPYSGNDSLLTQLDPNNLKHLNYGNSDYDIRHFFQGTYSWTPGWKFSNGFLNSSIGGWTLGQTFYFRTGLPFTVYDSSLSTLIRYYGGDLPANYIPGFSHPISCGRPGTADNTCFTSALFSLDPSGSIADPTIGVNTNQRRNQFRGPYYFDSDLSLSKLFKVTENLKLGVGAQAFNVLNHPNFANPNNDLGGSGFGSITSTVSPPTSPFGAFAGAASGRVLQVSAKIVF
jgi:outer membrane receptor protein involved in Fe transport